MTLKRAVLGITGAALLLGVGGGLVLAFVARPGDLIQLPALVLSVLGFFGLPALAAAYLREHSAWPNVMLFVIGLSLLGAVSLACGIMVEAMFPLSSPMFDLLQSMSAAITITCALWSVMLCVSAGLGLVRLQGAGRWVPRAAIIGWLVLAAMLTAWWGGEGLQAWSPRDDDLFLRIATIWLFVVLATTLGTAWIYHRQKQERLTAQALASLDLAITCPRCGCEQTVRPGHSRCRQCRLKFHIQVEEPRCPKCNYVLHMLTRPVCPECGTSLGQDEIIGSHEA